MRIERIVNSFLQSNTFILSFEGENDVYIVDIGDIEPLFKKIGKKNIRGLFLTHAHYDHIYGINRLLDKFPQCTIYGSKPTFDALKNDKLNFSYYYDKPLLYKGGKEIILENEQKVSLWGNIKIQALITSGHTIGSTCYRSENNFFTGDAYIPNVPPVTKLKEGNKKDADKSIEFIKSNLLENDYIHPGHLSQYIMRNGLMQPIE